MVCPFVLAAFGLTDWSVIVLYFLGMIAIGAWASRHQRDEESYFLGGRNVPTWAVTLSILATALSAATFIGVPQVAYNADLTYLALNIGGVLGAIIVAFFFLPVLYRAGTITIYGYLRHRFGVPGMVAVSIWFLIGRLLSSSARMFMAGIAFSIILFGSIETGPLIIAIILFGAVGTIYTWFGGIKAVIWTDVMQMFVMVFAVILSIVLLWRMIPLDTAGMVHELRDVAGRDKLRVFDWSIDWQHPFTIWASLAATLLFVASYGADHDMAQRMLCTRSAWRSSLSIITSTLIGIPVILLFLIVGLLLYIFYGMPHIMGDAAPTETLDDTRQVFPQFLVYHLPTGLSGLVMAGLLASVMSTFDSAINAMASVLVADIIEPWREHRQTRQRKQHAQRHAEPHAGGDENNAGDDADDEKKMRSRQLSTSRGMVLVMGVLLTCFSIGAVYLQQLAGQTLIDYALSVMTFAYAGILGVFFCALFTRRGNNTSVIAALIVGTLVILLLQPYILGPLTQHLTGTALTLAWPWWMLIATPLSFAICAWPGRNAK